MKTLLKTRKKLLDEQLWQRIDLVVVDRTNTQPNSGCFSQTLATLVPAGEWWGELVQHVISPDKLCNCHSSSLRPLQEDAVQPYKTSFGRQYTLSSMGLRIL